MYTNKMCKLFIIQTLIVLLVLNLIAAVVSYMCGIAILTPLMVSTLFVMLIDIASALIWRWVAKSHVDMLPSFFTGVSTVRFLGALAVFFVWFMVSTRESLLQFFIIFFVFYMISLLHHSIFFSRVSNRL